MATRSNDELLDLLLLGLTWVQEAAGSPTGWKGNGVFQTMRQLGGVSDEQYHKLAAGDQGFRNFLVPLTENLYGRNTGAAKMRKAAGSTKKPLVAAVNTGMFFGDKLFVPGGYKLVASELGQQRALQAAARYLPYVTRDGFRGQWTAHARQMRGMNARLGHAE